MLQHFFKSVFLINIFFFSSISEASLYGSIKPENIKYLGIESYRNMKISNWAKNVQFRPEIVFIPKTRTDLIEIVKDANEKNKRITTIGKAHSWNSLMDGSDYLVSTVGLKQFWIHPENNTVTVEAGVTIEQLDKKIRGIGFMVACNIVGSTDI